MVRNCILGCKEPLKPLYEFPCKEKQADRRNYWLGFFGIEDPKLKHIFACGRHFSSEQKACKKTHHRVPDIPFNTLSTDPLKITEIVDKHQSVIPVIKSVSTSVSSQTDSRLCGSVKISEALEEYHLSCFYCCENFPLSEWSEFVDHLKEQHFEREAAFKTDNDYDYSTESLQPPSTHDIHISLVKEEPLDIELAETVIKVLDETLFKADFKPKEYKQDDEKEDDDDYLDTKPSGSKSLNKNVTLSNSEALKQARRTRSLKAKFKLNTLIRKSQQRLKRNSKNAKQIKARIRPQREMSSGLIYIKDIESNQIKEETNSEKPNDLNSVETEPFVPSLLENAKIKSSELVFELTPRNIILDLLDCIQNFPILWEFHQEPNNAEYAEAINNLCLTLNSKWFLNISALQTRRSINRILTYFRNMVSCQKVKIFKEYFLKLSEFLPSSRDAIPQYRCEFCDICYRKDYELKKHLTEEHVYTKFPYVCDYCSERFMENDEYELHKYLPHLNQIFRCRHCSKTFKRNDLLNNHLKEHDKKKSKLRKCDLCGKKLKTSSELYMHKIRHGEKRFPCNLCEKSFYRRIELKCHLKRHTQQLDFICEVCGKAFLSNGCLQQHKAKHTGEKIACNICHTKIRKCNLLRHLKLCHVACEGTIESTFRSKTYNYKMFASNQPSDTLEPGKSRKRGPDKTPRIYSCKECNINFDRLKWLKDHNKECHTNQQAVACRICDSKVQHKSNLRRHYKQKHKLHMIQIVKIINGNEDVDKVLNMNLEELPPNTAAIDTFTYITEKNRKNQDMITIDPNDYIQRQDEVMEAVESIEETNFSFKRFDEEFL